MTDALVQQLIDLGLPNALAWTLSVAASFAALAVAALLAYVIAAKIVVAALNTALRKHGTVASNAALSTKLLERLAAVVPGVVVNALGPEVLSYSDQLVSAANTLSMAYIVIVIVGFLNAAVDAVLEIYNSYDFAKAFPITSLSQVAKLLLVGIGAIVVVAILMNESPNTLLTALAAVAAGATFVFKDSILGFVAGLQLTANQMVAVGDWIEVPSHAVDGEVLEIAMTTVKVRNWDNTITTLPTYSLISGSFKNWRGMTEAGGRRIKRSVLIDVESVRFCDEALLTRLRDMALLKDHLAAKDKEITAHNADVGAPASPTTEGRRLTNVGCFRAYLLAYLKAHPEIHQAMTILVRQRAPTDAGLPIELYAFTHNTGWTHYEDVQADVFDHILAAAHEFDLRVVQSPTGEDVRDLGRLTGGETSA